MNGADRTMLRAAFFGFALVLSLAAPVFAMSSDADAQCDAKKYRLDPNLQSTQINNNVLSPYFGMRGLLGKRCVDVTNEMVTEGKCIADTKCQAVSFENAQGKQQAIGKPDIPVNTKTIPQGASAPTGGTTQNQLQGPANPNINSNLFNPTPSAQQQGQVQPNASGGALQGIESFAKDGWGKVENIFSPTPTASNPPQPSFTGSGDLQNAGSVQPTIEPEQKPLYDSSSFQTGQQTFGGGNTFEPQASPCESWFSMSCASSVASSVGAKVSGAMDYLTNNVLTSPANGSPDAAAVAKFGDTGTITGDASTYNPFKPGWQSGGTKTATGDWYDPTKYEAALQLDLAKTSGCGYGAGNTCFAQVDYGDKSLIVKVNDNGPLTGNRVIDLNSASMGYFGGENAGVLKDVKVTILPGDSYTPGPITNQVPLPPENPLTADLNSSALPVTAGVVTTGPDLAPPDPVVAVTQGPDLAEPAPVTQVTNGPDLAPPNPVAPVTSEPLPAASPNWLNTWDSVKGTVASAGDTVKSWWNSASDYVTGGPSQLQPVQPGQVQTYGLGIENQTTAGMLGLPEPLAAAPVTPVTSADLPPIDNTVPGAPSASLQFDNPYAVNSTGNGTAPTNAQVFDTSAPNATQFTGANSSPASKPDVTASDVPLPPSRPSDVPINGADVRTGSDISAPLAGATDQRTQQSPDTVDIKVPLPPEPAQIPEAVDSQVRAAFDQKIKDANAQVAYAQSLVAAHPDSATAQAILDESNKRLDAIVSNSISYSTGNLSPDLKAAVDQLQNGTQQGTLSSALSSLSNKANSDAASIASGMQTSYDLSTLSGWGSAAKSAWDASAWGLAKTTATFADTANDILTKTGAVANPTADLNNAIDPYGKDYQTVSDIAVVAPFGYGGVKSLANAGIDAGVSAFSGAGRSAIADSALGDAAAPIVRDSAGFTSSAGVDSAAEAPVVQTVRNAGVDALNTAAADINSTGARAAIAAPEISAGAENGGTLAGSLPKAANITAPGTEPAVVVPSSNASIAEIPSPGSLPKAANISAPGSEPSLIAPPQTSGELSLPKAANIPAPATEPAPTINPTTNIDQAIADLKAGASAPPEVAPSAPVQTGAPEIPVQTVRPSVAAGDVVQSQAQSKSWLDTIKGWFTSSTEAPTPVKVAEVNPSVTTDAPLPSDAAGSPSPTFADVQTPSPVRNFEVPAVEGGSPAVEPASAPIIRGQGTPAQIDLSGANPSPVSGAANGFGESGAVTPVNVYDSSIWTGRGFQGFDIKAPWQNIPTAEIPVPEGNVAPTLVKPFASQPELPFGETPQLQPSDIAASPRPSASVVEPPITEPVAPESNYAVTSKPTPVPVVQEITPVPENLSSPASGFEIPKAITNPEPIAATEPAAVPKTPVATAGQTEALGEGAPAIVSEDMKIPQVDIYKPAAAEVPTAASQPSFAERFGSWAGDNKTKVALYGGLGVVGGIAGYDILSSGNSTQQATKDYSTPLPGSAPLGQGGPRSDATAPKPVYEQPAPQPKVPAPQVPIGPQEPVGIGPGNSGFNGFLSNIFGSLMQMFARQSQSPSTATARPVTPTPPVTPTTTTPVSPAVVTLIANPASVISGGTTKLSWSAVGASTCTLYGPGNTKLGQGNPDGSATSPKIATTTPFLVSCAAQSGTIYATTSVSVK